MKFFLQNQLCDGQNKKRAIALALLICIIAVSLFSGVLITNHAGHVHDHNGAGGNCAVCIEVKNTKSIFEQLFIVAVGLFVSLAGLYTAAIVNAPFLGFIFAPIASKVRMNN